jgi:hypothetical protein
MDLPMELEPDPALRRRVVSAVVAAGLVRRQRAWRIWVPAAAAAMVILAIGVSVVRPRHTLAKGNTYVLLLDEDSTFQRPAAGHRAERRAELARWADSLDALGKFEQAGQLIGPGSSIGGLFMIRAADDSDAARIAASCPLLRDGGRGAVKRFEP